jgi:hypothetical protein
LTDFKSLNLATRVSISCGVGLCVFMRGHLKFCD